MLAGARGRRCVRSATSVSGVRSCGSGPHGESIVKKAPRAEVRIVAHSWGSSTGSRQQSCSVPKAAHSSRVARGRRAATFALIAA